MAPVDNTAPAPPVPAPLGAPRAPRARASRRRRRLLAGAALLVIAAVILAWLLARANDVTPGPLHADTVDSIAFGQPGGVPAGWGTPVIWNDSNTTAVLDRVTVLDATPGLHILETHINGPARKFLFFSETYAWPDPNAFTDLHPVKGMTVAPAKTKQGERGVELVFALRADRPGQYRASRIAVDYHVGDTKHRAIIRSGLTVCVTPPGKPRDRNCPAIPAT